VAYDGCAYDPTGAVTAHDAASLGRLWDLLPSVLEGQFVILRVSPGPRLDVLIDPLGLAQVFVARRNGSWLVSNSARLLALALPEARTEDTVAADLYMVLGWTTGEHTWHDRIRVVPGGERWTWTPGRSAPERTTYFSARAVAREAARDRHRPDTAVLASHLEAGLRALDGAFGPLVASLSGGRDSRTTAALLLHAGIDARFYTIGAEQSLDVDIARELAAHVGLDHEVVTFEDRDIVPRWGDLARELVAQTDGMVSIREMTRLAHRPAHVDRLGVELWGAAGGIAKGNWMDRRLFGPKGAERVVGSMLGRLGSDSAGLVDATAIQSARRYLQRYFDEAVETGVAPLDVPALFSAEERVRRWEYGNARIHTPEHDVFSPFATRAWVRAAFSLPPIRRFSSPLHYRLTAQLAPELVEVRYDRPWPSQIPWLNLLDVHSLRQQVRKRTGRDGPRPDLAAAPVGSWQRPDRFAWLEAKREEVRELCLDHPSAAAWHAVDRAVFERIMAPDTDPSERRRRANGILYFAAPFYYEDTLRTAARTISDDAR
jgi:hypothetical protein